MVRTWKSRDLLLSRGARRDVRDHHSTTPLDWAARMPPWRTQAPARQRAEELVRLLSEDV